MKTIEESILSVKSFDFKTATQKEIEEILPTFGMNNECINEIPNKFSPFFGWGIKCWQYPNQFSKFLTYLRNIEVSSYLEIGVRHGGTFIIINEILLKNNPHLESHALDMIPQSEILKIYQTKFRKQPFNYHTCSSQDLFIFGKLGDTSDHSISKQIDMVFIDGCHSYHCAKRDYLLSLMLGAKYIILHDIKNVATKGVKNLWAEIKRTHKICHEFTDQYDDVEGDFMGIGVIEITEDDNIFPLFKPHYHHLFEW